MKGAGKALAIVGTIIAFMLFFAWISSDNDSLDNSLENIDDTKFPISDYLYFEKPLEPVSPPNQNIYNIPNNVNNPNNTNNQNNTNAETNPFADSNDETEKKDEKSADNNATKKDESSSGIGDLFDKALGNGKEVADSAKKATNEIFE